MWGGGVGEGARGAGASQAAPGPGRFSLLPTSRLGT